jgi:DnaJ family protein A protein 5
MTVIQDHYEVLDVPISADADQIKKAHRKQALKWHPDKNVGNDAASANFQLIQQAYECLKDPGERKWYDEHREAILRGWSVEGDGKQAVEILFDVIPFMHVGCYSGYGDDEGGFFSVYTKVFTQIFQQEQEGWVIEGNIENMPQADLPTDYGTGNSNWSLVGNFYTLWESFCSCRAFAWADKYNTKDSEDRRMRRAMTDENKKARRVAKKRFNDDIAALVHFIKRRDPRVKAHKLKVEQDQAIKKEMQRQEAQRKKKQTQQERQEWKQQSEEHMAQLEKEDRAKGRIRLADLEDGDVYNFGGGKGKKSKRKNKQQTLFYEFDEADEVFHESDKEDEGVSEPDNSQQIDDEDGGDAASQQPDECQQIDGEGGDDSQDTDDEVGGDEASQQPDASQKIDADIGGDEASQKPDESQQIDEVSDEDQFDEVDDELFDDDFDSEEESEEEEEPDFFRCECCRKDFKSVGQMENHMKSKKHKESFKKWEAKQEKKEDKVMEDLLDELELDP